MLDLCQDQGGDETQHDGAAHGERHAVEQEAHASAKDGIRAVGGFVACGLAVHDTFLGVEAPQLSGGGIQAFDFEPNCARRNHCAVTSESESGKSVAASDG